MAPVTSPQNKQPPSTKAGITTTADGQRVIPASMRADGSARREIRVRPGYQPPEDVEIYQNKRAEAWKNRGRGGVPGAAPTDEPQSESTGSNKNAKRRAARKRAKENIAESGETPNPDTQSTAESKSDMGPTLEPNDPEPADEGVEKEKKAKALRKKIRQANELKVRSDGGETLLPEQLDKVMKLDDLVQQLKALGFEN